MPNERAIIAKIEKEGQYVTFTRTNDDGTTIQAQVKACVTGYSPVALGMPGGGFIEGDRVVRVSVRQLQLLGWPSAPVKPDQIAVDDEPTVVQSCETLSLRGKSVEHVIHIRGG